MREAVERNLAGLPVQVKVQLVREVGGAIDLDARLNRAWHNHDRELGDFSVEEFGIRLRSAAEKVRPPHEQLSTADDNGWQRAKLGDLARQLQRAITPVRDRVRDICVSVLGGSTLSKPTADLLRPLLHELSTNLNGCADIEQLLRDFELLLKDGAQKLARGKQLI
jgi:hypothetical protein